MLKQTPGLAARPQRSCYENKCMKHTIHNGVLLWTWGMTFLKNGESDNNLLVLGVSLCTREFSWVSKQGTSIRVLQEW